MSDLELKKAVPEPSGLVKPGMVFGVATGTYIYTGGLTPETSSLRLDGFFRVVERVTNSEEVAWWCRIEDSRSFHRFQICVREADILAYTTPNT